MLNKITKISCLENILENEEIFNELENNNLKKFDILFRQIAHKFNYILPTSNIEKEINFEECNYQPFRILSKPEFYNDPVLVFKIHLLFPSVILSNNLCYSTYIGEIIQKSIK